MKCICYIGLLLCIFGNAKGQYISKQVYASTGDYFEILNFGTLEGTLGELSTSSITFSGGSFHEGFHHPLMGLTTSIQKKSFGKLDIIAKTYPNPTRDFLVVNLNKSDKFHLILSDSQNRIIQSVPCIREVKLDLSRLPAGTYFIQIYKSHLKSEPIKIIKF